MYNIKDLSDIIINQINQLQEDNFEVEIVDKKSLGFLVSYVNYLINKYLTNINDEKQKKEIKKILILESLSNIKKNYPVITILKLCNRYSLEKNKEFLEGKLKMNSLALYYLHLDSYKEDNLFYFFVKNEYKKIAY